MIFFFFLVFIAQSEIIILKTWFNFILPCCCFKTVINNVFVYVSNTNYKHNNFLFLSFKTKSCHYIYSYFKYKSKS